MNNHRRNSVIICSRLTYIASLTHENRNQTKQLSFSKLGRPFLLILCFLLIYCLFFYINIKEVLSAWSVGQLHFDQNMPFYTVKGLSSNFLMILLLIQLIWGAFFIKESCISLIMQLTLSLAVIQPIGIIKLSSLLSFKVWSFY